MPLHPISLSVVVMAYNEAATIEAVVRETLDFLGRTTTAHEVVVVDDGSTDGMGAVIDRLAEQTTRVRAVHHPRNLGMGAAIRSGYTVASCDFVTQLPGDGQVDPAMIERFLPHLATRDLVLSTYTLRDDGFLRAVVTRGYRAVASLLLGNPCAFTGTMVFRRSLLDRVTLTLDSFMVNVELPLKLLRSGVIPAFVTIEARPRAHGRSKVLSPRRVVQVVGEMIRLRRELAGTSRG